MHLGRLQIYLYKWERQLIARQFSGETNSLFGIVLVLTYHSEGNVPRHYAFSKISRAAKEVVPIKDE